MIAILATKEIRKRNTRLHLTLLLPKVMFSVATPLWDKCEGEAHTSKSGKLEPQEKEPFGCSLRVELQRIL
jgi:hypothetical protein